MPTAGTLGLGSDRVEGSLRRCQTRPVPAGSVGSALTAEEIERRVLAMLPEVRERGDEVASLRRLPRDLVDSLNLARARMLTTAG
jgi:hypothetical protein